MKYILSLLIACSLSAQAPTPVSANSFGDPTELYLDSPSGTTTIDPWPCLTFRNQIIINVGWLTADTDSYSVTVFLQWVDRECLAIGPAALALGLNEGSPVPGLFIEPLIILPMPYYPDLYGWGWGALQLPIIMPGPIDHVIQAATLLNGQLAFTQAVRITF